MEKSMISLCSVMLDHMQEYREIFVNSIISKTKLISEVVFTNNSKSPEYFHSWIVHRKMFPSIVFKEYGTAPETRLASGDEHGLGLNLAIEKTSNEHVYLCDPDIFFYFAIDEFFFNLKEKYNLQAIGVSHHSAIVLCQTFFPWHGSILMSKKDLPNEEFLKNELPIKGKYLMAGNGYDPVLSPKWITYKNLYPNPEGNWDTSSALYLHAVQNKWKWLAFQTVDTHNYTTQYFRSNIKISERFKKEKLLHHAVSGALQREKIWENFKKASIELV
jgi:hypothetical protein